MKLTMLGSGGGRFVVMDQLRETGGFVLEISGKMLMFDPGPGAVINAKKYNVPLKKLDGILVTHAHLDHVNDLNFVIEVMTNGTKLKRGFLVADSVTVNGAKNEPARLIGFQAAALEEVHVMKAGEKIETAGLKVTATKSTHGERKPNLDRMNNNLPTHGYVLESYGEKFGYTSDGEYYPGMEKPFQGCNLLVINCMRPSDKPWPGQMDAAQAMVLIEKAKPGAAVLNHLGMRMVFGRSEQEARKIEKQTGVRTLAATDGMVIDTKSISKKKIR